MEIPTPWGIQIGDYLSGNAEIPAILPTAKTGFCLHYDAADEDRAIHFSESAALNLMAELPANSLHVHLIDYNMRVRIRFPHLSELFASGLCRHAGNSAEAESLFNDIEQLVQQRHRNLLGIHTPDLIAYNRQSDDPQPYHLLLINADDYPDERTSWKRLQNLYQAAAEAGVYLIAYTTDNTEPRCDARDWLRTTLPALYLQQGNWRIPPATWPLAELGDHLRFEAINPNKAQIVANILAAQEKSRATDTLQDYLDVRIGTLEDGRTPFHFRLGYREGNHHAILIGANGSGKSALLNNLILRIGEKYSIKETRLYLMDYKQGVEYQAFANHPSVERIYLDNNDIAAGENLLAEFAATCQQRGELFRQHGTKDIDAYNRRFPNAPLPRLILIIEEFQVMLADIIRGQRVNNLLSTIVRQGRAFGIHLILATQNLSNISLAPDIRAEIGLRMSFKLNDTSTTLQIFEMDNTQAASSLPRYHLLYNDNFGHRSANHVVRTDPPEDIAASIARLRAARSPGECLTPQIATSPPESATPPPASPPPISTNPTLGGISDTPIDHSEEERLCEQVKQAKQPGDHT